MSTSRPLDQLKVAELKEELKKRGLSLKGVKKDLFERLEEAVRREEAQAHARAQAQVQAQAQIQAQFQAQLVASNVRNYATEEKSDKASWGAMEAPTPSPLENFNGFTSDLDVTEKENVLLEVSKTDAVVSLAMDSVIQVHVESSMPDTEETASSMPDTLEPAPAPTEELLQETVTESPNEQHGIINDTNEKKDIKDVAAMEDTHVVSVSDPKPNEVIENVVDTSQQGLADSGNTVVLDTAIHANSGNDASITVVESVVDDIMAPEVPSNQCEPVSGTENLVSVDNVNVPVLENVVCENDTIMRDAEKSNLTGVNVCKHPEEHQEHTGPTSDNSPVETEHTVSVGNAEEIHVDKGTYEKVIEHTEILSGASQADNEKDHVMEDVLANHLELPVQQTDVNSIADISTGNTSSVTCEDSTKPIVTISNLDASEAHNDKCEEKPTEDKMEVDKSANTEVPSGSILEEESIKNVETSDGLNSILEETDNDKSRDTDINDQNMTTKGMVSKEEPRSEPAEYTHTGLSDSRPSEDSSYPLSGQKRKDDGVESKLTEPAKRVRRWSSANQSPSGTVKPLTTDTVKEITNQDQKALTPKPSPRLIPTSKPLQASGKSDPPPPKHAPTTSLKIERFVRPFTLKAAQEMLSQFGELVHFWMDAIKTHCYVTYASVEEATTARNRVYNAVWPPPFGNMLVAEFVEPNEVKIRVEGLLENISSLNHAAPPNANQVPASQPAHHPPGALLGHQSKLPPPPPREREVPVAKKDPEPPVLTLDDLFFKTKAKPHIYYLPLTDEQVAAKSKERSKQLNRA